MFNLEGIENVSSSLEQRSDCLSGTQMNYLQELSISPEKWNVMSASEQSEHIGLIMGRISEIDLPPNLSIHDCLKMAYGDHICDSYLQLEAPSDIEQIMQISDIIEDYEPIKFSNWNKLELSDKLDVLNDLEDKIAKVEHRPACLVCCSSDMGHLKVVGDQVCGQMGGYRPWFKDINLNSELLESSNVLYHKELINTLVHEGRHAYQDYNINVCEVHPRHSEVESWAETMEGGRWGYWGDTSSIMGQRLYEQQAVEIDARNFARDVINTIGDDFLA